MNHAKATEYAQFIQIANGLLFQIQESDLFDAADKLRSKANLYDSTAALNRNWNREHHKVLLKQSEALEFLAKYIQANKDLDRLAVNEAEHKLQLEMIAKRFE